MNELGKFNDLSDAFRGDEYDGWRVHEGDMTVRLECDEDSISFPIKTLPISYVGANKVPVFSAVQLDESLFDKVSESMYRFKQAAIDHMEQFGQYAIWLSKTELIKKVEKYADENNVKIHCGNIKYVDISKPLPQVNTWEEQIHEFIFVKTISGKRDYQHQNEWRVAITYPQVVPNDESHIIIDIGKLEYAKQIPSFRWLKDGVLHAEFA